ncbi:MAG: patatin-like phospholipase family protein [Myxococcaceae bacterium]
MGFRTAMVLGGGGARGAYEAGVIAYLEDELGPRLGRRLQLDILCGTSVGALHSCYLAAWDGERPQGQPLVEYWRTLRINEVLAFGIDDVGRVLLEAILGPTRALRSVRAGGLVDPKVFEERILSRVNWPAIEENLRTGRLHALSLAATHVASGCTTLFVQRANHTPPPWPREPNIRPVVARIGPAHAMASAAIPLLFPAVNLGGSLYVDGGLRLNVPLAPAVRLGAQRVIVLSLRHREATECAWTPAQVEEERTRERVHATAPFLVGKVLNALLLDHTEQDVDRLRRINSLLVAGTRAYGRSFSKTLDSAIPAVSELPVRYVRHILLRPSRDLASLALEHARSPEFVKRSKGLSGSLVRRLADRQESGADLVSYLLFDGGYADMLIELGRKDARACEEAWARFWSEKPEHEAEAAALEEVAPTG